LGAQPLPIFHHVNAGAVAALSAAIALLIVLTRMSMLARRNAKLDRLFFALPSAVRAVLVKDVMPDAASRGITYLSCRLPDVAQLEQQYRENASQLVRLLDGILQSLLEAALSTGGTVERFAAGGFSVCWGAPLANENHAAHACAAAARMLSVMQQHNRFPLSDGRNAPRALSIAIGIASGPAISGVFGKTWSVAGECVSRAEELRMQCATLGFSVIVDAATQASTANGFALLQIGAADNLQFALLGDQGMRVSPKYRALSTFHERIWAALDARAYSDARELILQAKKLSGASAKFYDQLLARISDTPNAAKQNVA
jgi:adenylate cyclase